MKHFYTILAVMLAILPNLLYATSPTLINDTVCGGSLATGQIDSSCIPEYIAFLIEQLFMLTGGLSLIMIMVGGFEYTLDKIVGGKEKGVKRIRNGILGLVISGFAFFIVRFAVLALRGS